jgi:hypothetical protein
VLYWGSDKGKSVGWARCARAPTRRHGQPRGWRGTKALAWGLIGLWPLSFTGQTITDQAVSLADFQGRGRSCRRCWWSQRRCNRSRCCSSLLSNSVYTVRFVVLEVTSGHCTLNQPCANSSHAGKMEPHCR